MKISIVTINLNMKDGLEKSIKSLISQNQKNNIEYIVVDGLSTDGSQDIIEQYKEYIDKIIIEKDNGIFDAMNKGIDLATGEYIYFLNAGDEFAGDDVLKKVIEEIEKDSSKHSIYVGDLAMYDGDNYIGIANLYPWLPHQAVFIKKDIMKKYMFDSKFKIFGDLDLWTRLRKENLYFFQHINKLICNMKVDGIGSHPEYTLKRLKDKWLYTLKHKNYLYYFLSSTSELIGYWIYKLFGENFYFNKYIYVMQNFKFYIKKLGGM